MIKEVLIKNFMGHSELERQNIPGVNLIIGKNDTGKTGLLKLLYATAKALEIYSLKEQKSGAAPFRKELAEKMLDTFMPRKSMLGELVQKGSRDKLEARIRFAIADQYKQTIHFGFGESTSAQITQGPESVEALPKDGMNALFIPAKEVLTAFSDIRSMRESFYGRGFDDTYLDLIKALSLEPTRASMNGGGMGAVNTLLEELFEGTIEQTGQKDQPFVFKKGNQQFSMQQTAEGIKKIGILTTLIANRQLRRGTILFMDEPETALHPDAIRKLMEMLTAMSKNGVQIFLASHSYFVMKQLALSAFKNKLHVLCWSLDKKTGQPVTHSFYDMVGGNLPENSIVQESLAMYDEDLKIQLNL